MKLAPNLNAKAMWSDNVLLLPHVLLKVFQLYTYLLTSTLLPGINYFVVINLYSAACLSYNHNLVRFTTRNDRSLHAYRLKNDNRLRF